MLATLAHPISQKVGAVARREFLQSAAALGASLGLLPLLPTSLAEPSRQPVPGGKKVHVVVVGAGAFGGWSALHLLRRGARVTLLDAWGPGNSRASSGGETRVIRATYGPDRIYVELVVRALELWREADQRWQRHLFHPTGVLWMAGAKDDFEKAALPILRELSVPFETLTPAVAGRRYPQIDFTGVSWVLHEPESGYLRARAACQAVVEAFVAEGGEFVQESATPGSIADGEMRGIVLPDGGMLTADQYVFACGPWLGKIFPDVLGGRIHPTRQEVFFFGPPAGDQRFQEGSLPVWIDNGERLFYGIPDNEGRGFKLADDTRGPAFDPTTEDRVLSVQGLEAARRYLKLRFPGMARAPLVESRVCQYENSPDLNFIVDRHPAAANLLLVGGGSGHGFKHGPAVGERVAAMVLEQKPADPVFALSRF